MTQRRWAALIPRVFGKAAVTERILCIHETPLRDSTAWLGM